MSIAVILLRPKQILDGRSADLLSSNAIRHNPNYSNVVTARCKTKIKEKDASKTGRTFSFLIATMMWKGLEWAEITMTGMDRSDQQCNDSIKRRLGM